MFVYHFVKSWIEVWDILEKERKTEKGGIEIEDWGTSVHLCWGFKKVSCRDNLPFYYFFVAKKKKKIGSKTSIFVHSLIIEFFWFA